MIKEQSYYQHNKTGKAILVTFVWMYDNGKQVREEAHVRVVGQGRTRYMRTATIAKSYHEVSWKEVYGVK